MVKSLFSFAHQRPAEQRSLDLNVLLREEVELLERTTLSMVRLELDLEPQLKPILGDASSLTQAFMNLCVNAVDAMSQKGTLTLRTRNQEKEWVEVSVEDTGTGMPNAVLERALEPLFTKKVVGKGTGLGLSMVYSIARAHEA
jgi:two-component system, cell cycle sensor histidine kinase and response regulator CckA